MEAADANTDGIGEFPAEQPEPIQDDAEVKPEGSDGEVHDASVLESLLEKFPLLDQGKGLYMILRKDEKKGTWSPCWDLYIGDPPSDQLLSTFGAGEFAILMFGEGAKEEVEKLRNYEFTSVPDGAQLFNVKAMVEKLDAQDPAEGEDKPEEDKDYPLPTDKPFGYDWKKINFVDVGPNGVKLFPKDSEYPKPPEKEEDFMAWDGGHAVMGPKGIKLIPKNEKYPYPYPYPKPDAANDAAEKPKRVILMDSIETINDSQIVKNEDGSMVIKDAIIAKPMVQTYKIGNDSVRILKHPEELAKMAGFADHRYLCDNHPLERKVVCPMQIKGDISDTKVLDSGYVSSTLTVKDEKLQEKILKGKRDLSMGFDAALDWTPGSWTDKDGVEHEYDAIQRNILLDHVAVVEHGRCSLFDGCGIMLDEKSAEIFTHLDEMENLQDKLSALQDEMKIPLVDSILELSKKKPREELMKLDVAALKEQKELLLDAKGADLPGAPKGGVASTRKAVDDKFAAMGKNL